MFPFSLLLLSAKMYRPTQAAIHWLSFQRSQAAIRPAARQEKGQGLVEYALILVLVALLVIAVLAIFGPAIERVFMFIYCNIVTMGKPSFEWSDAFHIDENGVCGPGELPD